MLHIQCIRCGEIEENAYLITDADTGAAALIDPGLAEPIRPALAQLPGGALRMILLTHGHFDHIGGAAALAREAHVPVYCHERELPRLTQPEGTLAPMFGLPLTVPSDVAPLRTGQRIALGNTTLTVLHTPGHTPGSICFDEGSMLFSGDTLFCGGEGRTDFPGGSASQMADSLRRLALLDGDRLVYPGHGGRTTLSQERRINPWMVSAVRDGGAS